MDTITGDLIIQGTKLARLDAFSSLRHIGRDFYIGDTQDNSSLTTISGFNALESIGRLVFWASNTALTTATGFERLDSVGSVNVYTKKRCPHISA